MVRLSESDRLSDRGLEDEDGTAGPYDLADIFDAHASGLYDYAHGLLHDQVQAADAVRDTLIAAREHHGVLREPGLFRAWLYALLRAECLRRAESHIRPPQRDLAPETVGGDLDAEQLARRDEVRGIVISALAGLSGGQREIIDLLLRHGLNHLEVARVLGIPDKHSAMEAGQARQALDSALAAVVMARERPDSCRKLAALADTWPLPRASAAEIVQHVDTCRTCRKHRLPVISAARMLALLPVAQMPSGLRSEVMVMAADPGLVTTRESIALRAERFDERGWPIPPYELETWEPARKRGARLWPILIGGAVVVTLVAVALEVMPGGRTGNQAVPLRSGTPGATDAASPGATDGQTQGPTSGGPTASPSAKHSPSPSPSLTPTPTPSHSHPANPPAPPAPGALNVSGCQAQSGQSSCDVTVTAVGGPVAHWSVTGTSSNSLSASGSGTLSAGQSASVTVTIRKGICLFGGGSGKVYFSPSGSASVSWQC